MIAFRSGLPGEKEKDHYWWMGEGNKGLKKDRVYIGEGSLEMKE